VPRRSPGASGSSGPRETKDADLTSLLPFEATNWWEVWRAPKTVRSGGKWRAMFDRVTDNGKKDRSRGYIKVARELVKVVYVVWKKQVPYTDTPPARPGQNSHQNPNDTRSGTGQPFRPRVQA